MIEKKHYKTKDYCKVKFTIASDAKKVEIFGLNNEWKKGVALAKKKDGSFSVEMNIDNGTTHEFKYLVNATNWVNEPEADEEQPNAFGGSNSVIVL